MGSIIIKPTKNNKETYNKINDNFNNSKNTFNILNNDLITNKIVQNMEEGSLNNKFREIVIPLKKPIHKMDGISTNLPVTYLDVSPQRGIDKYNILYKMV
jgi:hypothetical protein